MSTPLPTPPLQDDPPRTVPSRHDVVRQVLDIRASAAEKGDVDDEQYLRRLAQTLRNRKGRFVLAFAVCNEVPLRRKLTQQLLASLPDQQPVELVLDGSETSLLNTLLAAPGKPEPLIVYGLERLLPSTEGDHARLNQTLREFQMQRERFRALGRPLVLWLPEYAYTLIGQRALDFWLWQSGGFLFGTSGRAPLFVASGRAVRSPQFNARAKLRTSPLDFVGRARQLAEVTTALRAGGTVVLHGMGGSGKTDLALRAADQLSDDFPDAQLFVSLRGPHGTPRPPADGLREIVRAFDPVANLPDDLVTLVAVYRTMLANRRALIIADDAPDAEALRPFVPPAGSALLVTARDALALPGAQLVALDQLAPDEARAMLLNIAGPLPPALADELCALCGYLPLAIRLAGGTLTTQSIAPAQYMEQLRAAGLRGIATAERSVEASFDLSYAPLDDEQARVFRLLALFPDSFDAGAEAEVCADTDSASLPKLVQRSLVIYDERLNRYHLHPLLRQYAAARAQPEEPAAAALRHARYYQRVLAAADDLYEEGGDAVITGLALFDIERANIEAGQSWAAAHAASDDEAAQLCSEYAGAGRYVLLLRLHPRERIRWLEAALAAAQHLQQPAAEGAHLGNLGIAYRDLGEVRRAIEYHEQALAIRRAIGDRRGEGADLGNLGIAYRDLDEVWRAIEYHEQALAINRAIGDPRGEGANLGNLGIAYRDLGEVRRAIEYYEQALAINRAIGDPHGEGTDLGNLGIAYRDLGEVRRAIEYYEQALAINRAIGDPRGEGAALGHLGSAYHDLGEVRRAIEYHEQALAISRTIGDRRGEGADLGNLGLTYYNLGEVRRAIEYYEQALAISRAIGNRRGEGANLGNLGSTYHDLGEVRRAIEYYEQALAISRAIGDRGNEGANLSNLGSAYRALGDPRRALELYERASIIFHEIEAKENEATALEGLRLARAALREDPYNTKPPKPPRSAPPISDTALTYSDAKRARAAIAAYSAQSEAHGDRRELAAFAAHGGAAHAHLGETQQAIECYEQALALLDAGGDAAGAAVVAWQFGQVLLETDEHARAVALMQRRLNYERTHKLTTAEFYEDKLEQACARAGQRAQATQPQASGTKAGFFARLFGRR